MHTDAPPVLGASETEEIAESALPSGRQVAVVPQPPEVAEPSGRRAGARGGLVFVYLCRRGLNGY